MTLLLAPMEGLLDRSLREVLTRVGGLDGCVSEFIRITDRLLPERVYMRVMPELLRGSRTSSGVPVRAQLLGSDPQCLAENAARLAALGPAGIDLNFGCPAKTVNRHRGGAVLLDEPELVGAIVSAVRRAVPVAISVSAKMRLGNQCASRALDNALAIEAGGADLLVVHARTKADGYRPPAFWDSIRPIAAALAIPVVANGEIWTVGDALRCREASGCSALMLGRGQVADPGLALAIALHDGTHTAARPVVWADLLPLLAEFWRLIAAHVEPRHRGGRLKQWLNCLRRRYPEAEAVYRAVRVLDDPVTLGRCLLGDPASAPAR